MTQASEQKSHLICSIYLLFVRTRTKFGIKIFEIDFVIGGGAKIFLAVACLIHVSNSHTKFGLISSNG